MGLYSYRIQDKGWDYFKEIVFFYQSFAVFNEQINGFIENDLANAKKFFDIYIEETKDMPDDFEYFNYKMDLKAREGLVNIYYDSLLISMHSFTEKKMLFLSTYLSKYKAVKVDDIAGKGIFKYRRYLEKVCLIDFVPIEKDWNLLLNFNMLRNHLIHAEGNRNISNTQTQLLNFLKTIHGVQLTEQGNATSFAFTTDTIIFDLLNCSQRIVEELYRTKEPIPPQ
jgi:hypothetical protein